MRMMKFLLLWITVLCLFDTTKCYKFQLYWNVKSEVCKGNESLHPENYGIKTNKDQIFLGDKIVTFYEADLGLYPKLIVKGFYSNYSITEEINSGLPQKCNITQHMEKAEKDIIKFVPNPDFDGPLVIDYESWRPLLDLNWGSHSHEHRYLKIINFFVFRNVSKKLAFLRFFRAR